MSRRGSELREHILYVAKDVFLEIGFERASMDVIAQRAETSKRTLYAHFENKEKLYFAVVELVRGIFLQKLKRPGDYSSDVTEALVLYCGRYLEALLFAPIIRMCRASMAEAERFPVGMAQYFDVTFQAPYERLRDYLSETFELSEAESVEAAEGLLGRVMYPRYPRALFGLDKASEHFDVAAIRADLDLEPIRKAVVEMIGSLKPRA